jgi:hypothetical protein
LIFPVGAKEKVSSSPFVQVGVLNGSISPFSGDFRGRFHSGKKQSHDENVESTGDEI